MAGWRGAQAVPRETAAKAPSPAHSCCVVLNLIALRRGLGPQARLRVECLRTNGCAQPLLMGGSTATPHTRHGRCFVHSVSSCAFSLSRVAPLAAALLLLLSKETQQRIMVVLVMVMVVVLSWLLTTCECNPDTCPHAMNSHASRATLRLHSLHSRGNQYLMRHQTGAEMFQRRVSPCHQVRYVLQCDVTPCHMMSCVVNCAMPCYVWRCHAM